MRYDSTNILLLFNCYTETFIFIYSCRLKLIKPIYSDKESEEALIVFKSLFKEQLHFNHMLDGFIN